MISKNKYAQKHENKAVENTKAEKILAE